MTNEQEILFNSVDCIISLLETFQQIVTGLELKDEEVTKILDALDNNNLEQLELNEIDISTSNGFAIINEEDGLSRDEVKLNSESSQKKLESSFKKSSLLNSNLNDFEISSYKRKLKQILKSSSDPDDTELPLSKTEPNNVTSSPSESHLSVSKSECENCEEVASIEDNQSKLKESNSSKDDNDEEIVSHKERENARQFFEALKNEIPHLLSLRTCPEVDNALQRFASKFCKG